MLRVAIAEDDFRIAQVQERFLLEVDGVEVVGKALNAKETTPEGVGPLSHHDELSLKWGQQELGSCIISFR